ncbi:MAG TPA: hypothetical protein VF680_17195 [Allosphingosinicella sp.]|jgi:uracil-DNA glycosylase
MVVEHINPIDKTGLKVNYSDELGTWAQPLIQIIIQRYMDNLAWFINQKYASPEQIYPCDKDDVFRAFRMCKYDELKVIFIGKQPYSNLKSNGLAYGVAEDTIMIPPALNNIKTCVENTTYKYQDNKKTFDYTLESWAEQGCLMLNTSLTSEFHNSHHKCWAHFTRFVIKHINLTHQNIAFVFLDNTCNYYKQFIDEKKHKIFSNDEIVLPKDSRIFYDLDKYVHHYHKELIEW